MDSIWGIIVLAILKVAGLVIMGFCLAIGFYLGKKVTNCIDQYLVENDPVLMAELEKSLP